MPLIDTPRFPFQTFRPQLSPHYMPDSYALPEKEFTSFAPGYWAG